MDCPSVSYVEFLVLVLEEAKAEHLALQLRIGDEEVVLKAGDMLVIPSEAEHEAWVLEDAVLLDFFAPRREDWRQGDNQYLKG